MGVIGVAYYYRNRICAWFLSQIFSFLLLGTFFVHLFGCQEIMNKKRSDVVACERFNLSLLGLDFALELALGGPSLSGLPLLLETQILKVSEPGKEIVAQSFQSATLFPEVEELMYTMMCFIEFKRGLPPGEVVVMPLHVTIGELKRAAESALGDTCGYENRRLG
ncbi:hypothetical protein C1H46_025953 [Malus baccata]|uniref:PHD finger protein MALE STERILITY 1-like ubiquitin-like domain-containing protein n=1 Tax=Malus baccata TaxID=106549 RepID=A0A540LPX7_MALBA|nr:hypothetical protein C1H46_025953 [Malus baccata]